MMWVVIRSASVRFFHLKCIGVVLHICTHNSTHNIRFETFPGEIGNIYLLPSYLEL